MSAHKRILRINYVNAAVAYVTIRNDVNDLMIREMLYKILFGNKIR